MAAHDAQPPRGFTRRESRDVVLVVEQSLVAAVERLRLLEAGGLARACAAAGGPVGRGRVAVLALEGRSERLCLRTVRRGGVLAAWLPAGLASLARPLAELEVTARLRTAGAPVPRPALVVGERRVGRGWDAAVGTVYEEDTVDGLAFLSASPTPARVLRAARAVGNAVRRFHDAGGRHADLHVKNVLLRERDQAVEVFVIDLDRARATEEVEPRARLAELMRLYRSLVKRGLLERVGPRGCAAFFAGYVRGDRALRRALRAGMGRERLRLALHGLHYRRA
jgi:3-deoxy-D-manno-octulosonic acid kinase